MSDKDRIEDLARSAFEEAMTFGIGVDSFIRLARVVAQECQRTGAAALTSYERVCITSGGHAAGVDGDQSYEAAQPAPAPVQPDTLRVSLWFDDMDDADPPEVIVVSGDTKNLRRLALYLEHLHARTKAAQAPAQPALDGFRLIAVKGFDALVAVLNRAESKGYMPDAIAEEWDAFDYREQAAPAQLPDGLIKALRRQEQCDEDGADCIVSRQAVCEAIDLLLAHYTPSLTGD